MKIGIITIVRVANYGAELQAYATQKVLEKLGYQSEIIDYLFYKNKFHKATKNSKPVFSMSIKKRLSEWLFPKITKFKSLFKNNNNCIRETNFTNFHIKNTNFSQEYRSYDDLLNAELDYDVYLVGSDQVWNPGIYSSLNPYFLKFAPQGKKKISYGSSLGVSSLPEYTINYYKKSWEQFDYISVREENAVEIIKKISGKEATWVLDPTLLLNKNDWQSIAQKAGNIPHKYIILYELTPCIYLKKLAQHIAHIKQCKIVRITKDSNKIEKDNEIINAVDAGPSEFLDLFNNTEFVVTNSFHGCAFSINMNKPFFVVAPARKNNNSRQQSLLNLFEIQERQLLENSPLPTEDSLEMDFSKVNSILETQREKSINYLKQAINE